MVRTVVNLPAASAAIRHHRRRPGLQPRVQLVHQDALTGRGSYEGAEAGQRCPRPGHIVHDDLAPVQGHDGAALGLRVRVARVVADGLLALPGLPQRVVHVGVVVHERVRVRADALVLAFGGLAGEGRERGVGIWVNLDVRNKCF